MSQEKTRADGAPASSVSDEITQPLPTGEETDDEQQAVDSAEVIEDSGQDDTAAAAEEKTPRVGANELANAQAQAEKNWTLYLGARAEADNIKKRAERDVQNAHKFALERFINELLPVKDSLELGLSAASETTDMGKLIEGSELTLKMLANVLDKFAVEEINPLGKKFDPQLHEAMAMQPSDEAEPNTVLQVIQKGYLLHGRLVRPALVIVSQAAQKNVQ